MRAVLWAYVKAAAVCLVCIVVPLVLGAWTGSIAVLLFSTFIGGGVYHQYTARNFPTNGRKQQ